ncbi:MAG: hypothetical protein DRQ01_00850 [Ignavibacteriae bacterium]|nr:MAG: hypothetical protein DRQ01_00850 [Ignavibacteriota bacterium]
MGDWLFVFWLMTSPGNWEKYEYVASSYINCWEVEKMFRKLVKEYNRYTAKDLYWIDGFIHSPIMYKGCAKI